ncbi:MAG: hypothetical protein ACXVII_33360, partial [Solirubrobacteraceae bacterium]
RQVIRRQPIPHVRRQQEPLLTTAFNEGLRHTKIVLNVPDRTPLCDNLATKQESFQICRLADQPTAATNCCASYAQPRSDILIEPLTLKGADEIVVARLRSQCSF